MDIHLGMTIPRYEYVDIEFPLRSVLWMLCDYLISVVQTLL